MGGFVVVLQGCSNDEKELNALSSDQVLLRSADASDTGAKYVPNEVIVKFKAGASATARENAFSHVNAQVAEKILTHAMKYAGDHEGIVLLKVPMAALDAVGIMKKLEGVEYAEPNYIYTTDATINDTYYTNGSLWGMYGDATTPKNQYGCQAGEAWAKGYTGSSDVYVGIIDEGYMYTHEDLATNAGKNPGEVAGNGIDDDGNGYIDDVYGWNFVNDNNQIFNSSGDDHGTHVAGTIGGAGGNGKGVAGVCWKIKFLSGKFLGKNGGTTINAIKAVDYFTTLKNKGVNLVATNNSWGGGGFSQALQDAIERANNAGILFIAAAGNDGRNIDTSPSYPASYPNSNIISVAAIMSNGGIASFSNYGATSVDLGAPGYGIYSSVPAFKKGLTVSGYASYSGTSMATPHVTGAAALYYSLHPNATVADIKNAILSSTIPTASLSGKSLTGGRLNVSGF
jgi:Subtilisin-like serine proteases